MITKTCIECGESFNIYPYRERTAKYCSMSCRSKGVQKYPGVKERNRQAHLGRKPNIKQLEGLRIGWERVPIKLERKKCIECGEEFTYYPSKGNRKFCSFQCYYEHGMNMDVLQLPENQKKRFKAINKKPNKSEQRLIKIIEKYKHPFKYVGDGSVVIYGLNPDFIECNGKKKIIEVFGEYWHISNSWLDIDWKKTEFGRKAIFSQLGYDALIIWYEELKKSSDEEISKRITNFCGGNNGVIG